MPVMLSNIGLAVELEAADALGEEGQRLAELEAREVGADAVVHAGAERERACAAAAVGGDVEAVGASDPRGVVVEVAVAGERADHHDRVRRGS